MKKFTPSILFLVLILSFPLKILGEDGYDLWQRYKRIENQQLLDNYRSTVSEIAVSGNSATIEIARNELEIGLEGLFGSSINITSNGNNPVDLLVGTLQSSNISKIKFSKALQEKFKTLGHEGFIITSEKHEGKNITIISANSDIGVLYGVFHFLRLIQTGSEIKKFSYC